MYNKADNEFSEECSLFKIVRRKQLNGSVVLMDIDAPFIAKKADAGQFVIVRSDEYSERIPLTIADFDREKGTVTIIFQTIGGSTMTLAALNEGDEIKDVVGPLGTATEYEKGIKKVAVVGGGVGCAIAYPQAKKLHNMGVDVQLIAGFRNQDAGILSQAINGFGSRKELVDISLVSREKNRKGSEQALRGLGLPDSGECLRIRNNEFGRTGQGLQGGFDTIRRTRYNGTFLVQKFPNGLHLGQDQTPLGRLDVLGHHQQYQIARLSQIAGNGEFPEVRRGCLGQGGTEFVDVFPSCRADRKDRKPKYLRETLCCQVRGGKRVALI